MNPHEFNVSRWNLREKYQEELDEGVGISSPLSETEQFEQLSKGGNTDTSKRPIEVKGFNANTFEGLTCHEPIDDKHDHICSEAESTNGFPCFRVTSTMESSLEKRLSKFT